MPTNFALFKKPLDKFVYTLKFIIFLKYWLIVWVARYFTVFMFLKLCFKIFLKRSHKICSNFAIIEAIMAGTYFLKGLL